MPNEGPKLVRIFLCDQDDSSSFGPQLAAWRDRQLSLGELYATATRLIFKRLGNTCTHESGRHLLIKWLGAVGVGPLSNVNTLCEELGKLPYCCGHLDRAVEVCLTTWNLESWICRRCEPEDGSGKEFLSRRLEPSSASLSSTKTSRDLESGKREGGLRESKQSPERARKQEGRSSVVLAPRHFDVPVVTSLLNFPDAPLLLPPRVLEASLLPPSPAAPAYPNTHPRYPGTGPVSRRTVDKDTPTPPAQWPPQRWREGRTLLGPEGPTLVAIRSASSNIGAPPAKLELCVSPTYTRHCELGQFVRKQGRGRNARPSQRSPRAHLRVPKRLRSASCTHPSPDDRGTPRSRRPVPEGSDIRVLHTQG